MSPSISSRSPVLSALADRQRQSIITLLRDRTQPLTEEEVATSLAVQEHDTPPARVTAEEQKSIKKNLRHLQLPLLEEHGLIKWDEEEATLTLSEHPVFDDPKLDRILNLEYDELADVLAAVSERRRRLVLRLLKEHNQAISQTKLARAIYRAETGTSNPDLTEINGRIASLYHNHLPKLDNTELIEYDYDEGMARYTENQALEEVFSILYESDSGFIEGLNVFFEGLEITARETTDRLGTESDLPEPWMTPHHG